MNTTNMPPLASPPRVQDAPAEPSACAGPESRSAEDPFRAIADAMEAAALEADRHDRTPQRQPKRKPARTSADAASREPAGGVGKAAYSVAYGLGFGVAFPAYFVLGLLPSDSSVARGLRDGAQAARDSLGQ